MPMLSMPTMQSLMDTFVFLMNTPLVPPEETQRDVPLTDMPVRSLEREARRMSNSSQGSSIRPASTFSTANAGHLPTVPAEACVPERDEEL